MFYYTTKFSIDFSNSDSDFAQRSADTFLDNTAGTLYEKNTSNKARRTAKKYFDRVTRTYHNSTVHILHLFVRG